MAVVQPAQFEMRMEKKRKRKKKNSLFRAAGLGCVDKREE